SNQPPAGQLHPLSTPSRPWSHIALDFITGLPPSAGNTVILTIIDHFSKAANFIALPKLPTALETARLLATHVFRLHGIPEDIVCDRGPQFTSWVWKEFCNSLGAKVSLSSGYHPQSNGQSERANQELETALRCVASTNQTIWSEELPWIEYAHNSLTASATGRSPFEASLGYQPPLFPAVEGEHSVPSVQAHLRRCRRVWRATQAALLCTKENNKRIADRHRAPAPDYSVGQKAPSSRPARGWVASLLHHSHHGLTAPGAWLSVPGGLGRLWRGGTLLGPASGRSGQGHAPGVPPPASGQAWWVAGRLPLRGGYCHGPRTSPADIMSGAMFCFVYSPLSPLLSLSLSSSPTLSFSCRGGAQYGLLPWPTHWG
uniref:Integrase catalytic domain-containing protein n=1 Tax=Oreochromis aureus TaxID=47969 RepID=A0AAZ1XHU1_OREAU